MSIETLGNANRDVLVFLASRMRYYTALEPLLRRLIGNAEVDDAIKKEAESHLLDLYELIIKFQTRCFLSFFQYPHSSTFTAGWDDNELSCFRQHFKKREERVKTIPKEIKRSATTLIVSLKNSSAMYYRAVQDLCVAKQQAQPQEDEERLLQTQSWSLSDLVADREHDHALSDNGLRSEKGKNDSFQRGPKDTFFDRQLLVYPQYLSTSLISLSPNAKDSRSRRSSFLSSRSTRSHYPTLGDIPWESWMEQKDEPCVYHNLGHEYKEDEEQPDGNSLISQEHVKSVDNHVMSLLESAVFVFLKWFFSLFTSEEKLLSFYYKATETKDQDDFVKNHAYLLTGVGDSLLQQPHTDFQKISVNPSRPREQRLMVSAQIYDDVLLSEGTMAKSVAKIMDDTKDLEHILDPLFLRDNFGEETIVLDTMKGKGKAKDESGSDLGISSKNIFVRESEGKNGLDAKLKTATEFLTTGTPYRNYHEGLQRLVANIPVNDNQSTQNSWDNQESFCRPDEHGDTAPNDTVRPTEGQSDSLEHSSEAPSKVDDPWSAWLAPTLPVLVDRILKLLPFLFSMPEPPVPPGKTRIRWKCVSVQSCPDSRFGEKSKAS